MLATSLQGNQGKIELTCDVEDNIWPVEVDLGELELALVILRKPFELSALEHAIDIAIGSQRARATAGAV